MKNYNKIGVFSLLFAFLLGFLFSCTGEDYTNNNIISSDETLDAWMKINHPDIDKIEDGFYLKVTGDKDINENPVDTSVVKINYLIKNLNDNIAGNTDAETARVLNKFHPKTNYKEPFTFQVNKYLKYNGMCMGINKAIKKITKGQTAEIYISPKYAYGLKGLDSLYLGYRGNTRINSGEIVHIIFSLDSFENEPIKSEKKLITEYVKTNFPKKFINEEDMVYIDKTLVSDIVKDSVRRDTTLKIDYKGYLPNGFVFDTSIKEVAQQNFFFDEKNKYEPYNYSYKRDDKEDFGSTIKAWKYAIKNMRLGETVTIIANSDFCYGNDGQYDQNSTILPMFTPLLFEIHILTPDEAREREKEEEN
ncbi:MAG: FKBP-type peptidyl-prolyl cis-trans isomerase [Bacteroidetes bacterium]|nr:FKBP-type peptidyl-prolyl cis-trans isomerase [Bacteroidota bacterium]